MLCKKRKSEWSKEAPFDKPWAVFEWKGVEYRVLKARWSQKIEDGRKEIDWTVVKRFEGEWEYIQLQVDPSKYPVLWELTRKRRRREDDKYRIKGGKGDIRTDISG